MTTNTTTEQRTKQQLNNGEWDGIHWGHVAARAAYDAWSTDPSRTIVRDLTDREELLAAAARKPVRVYAQYDAEHEPRDEHGDREGDVVWSTASSELRNTGFPVRVQILDGSDPSDVVRLLRKVLDSIESDAADLADKQAPVLMTTYTQCRYLRRNGELCTAEAIDATPDALIHLCAKHAGRVMELINTRLKEIRR